MMIITALLISMLAQGGQPSALIEMTSCEVSVKKSLNPQGKTYDQVYLDFCSNLNIERVIPYYLFNRYGERYISIDNTSLKEIRKSRYRSAGTIKNSRIKVKEVYDYRITDNTGLLHIRFDVKNHHEKFSIKQSLIISDAS